MYIDLINDRIRTQLTGLQEYLSEHVQNSESDEFDMSRYYCEVEDENEEVCGTSACLLGWLAISLDHTVGYDGVDLHSGRIQGWREFMYDFINTEKLEARDAICEWLFAIEWYHLDNTLGGGIKRISYLLAHGVPSSFTRQTTDSKLKFSREGYEQGFKAYSEMA